MATPFRWIAIVALAAAPALRAAADEDDDAPAPPPPIASSVFAPPPPPKPTSGELGAPHIHIRSDFPVTLHEVDSTLFGPVRTIVCQAPCDRTVDGRGGQVFYFAGDEIPQSARFRLIEKQGDVVAEVHAGNTAVRKTGSALMTPAGLTLLASVILWPFAALTKDPGTASSLTVAADVTTSVGVLSLLSGIAMIVGGRTRYSFQAVDADGLHF